MYMYIYLAFFTFFTAWLDADHRKFNYIVPGVAFLMDCRLNDPYVPVEIFRKKSSDSQQSYKRVDPKTDQFVKQNGKNFTITLNHGNMVDYKCRAGQPVLEKEVTLQRAPGLKQH